MNNILILGAGRSSYSLIAYLLEAGSTAGWQVVVGDISLTAAQARVGNTPYGKAIRFTLDEQGAARQAIAAADVVVSLLPPPLHPQVAKLCLELRKHLLTASYVSKEMRAFHDDAKAAGLLFLNECGLDPGIDHMSAMKVIDEIHEKGGLLTSFESFTGGLIAPDTDPANPWRYKFTWNPRNVVMAGQGHATYLEQGQLKYIPYQQIFSRTTPVHVPDYGDYEGYANRDSLSYMQVYGLQGIDTLLRGTLRNKGFCEAWQILVQLGCCDDTYLVEGVNNMTHRDFINSFLAYHASHTIEEKLMQHFDLETHGPAMERLRWSGLFSDEPVGLDMGTPAAVLEHILNKRWKLLPGDKDMIVMWHRFIYKLNGRKEEIQSSLVVTGEDANLTAMAKTVGLPLAIATRLLMEGKVEQRGVAIPVMRELYEPVLEELAMLGITMRETLIV